MTTVTRLPAFIVAGLTTLAALAAACSPFSSAPTGMAVVTGGIVPCSGLPPNLVPNLPKYSAGTVTVLRGKPYIRGNLGYLPTEVVTRQQVGQNQTYRFTLRPGDYVLQAKFPPVNGVQPNIEPDTALTLRAGQTLNRDIPNECI